MDKAHFEPTPPIGFFEKVYAKLAGSLFLNKSRVVGGSFNKSKSAGTFDDEKIELAREVEAICTGSAITITEL
jgi:hypothetical protein